MIKGRLAATALVTLSLSVCRAATTVSSKMLETNFINPPDASRPWVYWFWINGNISKEGITADLESMKRVGIGGVLWMEVSGPWWAPDGEVEALSPEWHDAFRWAISECRRLGLQFDVSLDFGYGSGGPHITPELSMQKLVWSEQTVEGGQAVEVTLKKPYVAKHISAWLRPGTKMNPEVIQTVEQTDSFRDVAVIAIPSTGSRADRGYRISSMAYRGGFDKYRKIYEPISPPTAGAVTPVEQVIDLTALMDSNGSLKWKAPHGKWLIIRYGHASNYQMTRPCPAKAVGLECDRLSKIGIETHFYGFLRKIIEDANSAAGGTLAYAHIDSWEAGYQNWTASFPGEFRKRREYDLRPWLPVMTGRVVGSADMSERFLWDVRLTVSEMIQENYALRLKELVKTHGMRLSIEGYGHMCIDDLSYAAVSDMPVGEFWARGGGQFPVSWTNIYEMSSKAMASAAHTCGKQFVGAEAFTSDRGWCDHPFLLKALGDKFFCHGVNRMVLSCFAHQPYGTMIPGLTHRRWGEHFQRHNTWWEYSRPWIHYIARSQYLLQQGIFVADVCYWFGEGAPLDVDSMRFDIPEGYDYDLCSSENVLQMQLRNGRIVLPSGMEYRYLLLPDSDRMTSPMARKIKELVDAGARVIAQKRLKGSPSLTNYPQDDAEVKNIAVELWDSNQVFIGKSVAEVFYLDDLKPDFECKGLIKNVRYIHRRVGEMDMYFVCNQENRQRDIFCTFRVAGKAPELWDPETGDIRKLPVFTEQDGRITVSLRFEPMQSWFVILRKDKNAGANSRAKMNFNTLHPLREISGPWQVCFDPEWGGPEKPIRFDDLIDWRRHSDPRIHYYSGTAVYNKTIELSDAEASGKQGGLILDLGSVDVMARVKLNGIQCGITWKPPYQVEVTSAVRPGNNKLEIDVVNLWINRMIGDEQLPEDSNWKDSETLLEWPQWFKESKSRFSGRFTFKSCKNYYKKDTALVPSGMGGPVKLYTRARPPKNQ